MFWIKEILKDMLMGVWHSLRGIYKWYSYDQPKTLTTAVAEDASSASISQYQGSGSEMTLTPHAQRLMHDRKKAAQIKPQKWSSSIRGNLYISMKYNLMLATFMMICTLLEFLLLLLVPSQVVFGCKVVQFIMKTALFFARVAYVKLTNMFLQSSIADKIFAQAIGPARLTNFAESGSNIYATVQLQIIYYILVNMLLTVLRYVLYEALTIVIGLFLLAPYWSFYSSDYCWHFAGIPISQKLIYVEIDWPYFVGFGLPMACIDLLVPNSELVIIFVMPFYIVSAVEAAAHPKPAMFQGTNVTFFRFAAKVSDWLHRFVGLAFPAMLSLMESPMPKTQHSSTISLPVTPTQAPYVASVPVPPFAISNNSARVSSPFGRSRYSVRSILPDYGGSVSHLSTARRSPLARGSPSPSSNSRGSQKIFVHGSDSRGITTASPVNRRVNDWLQNHDPATADVPYAASPVPYASTSYSAADSSYRTDGRRASTPDVPDDVSVIRRTTRHR